MRAPTISRDGLEGRGRGFPRGGTTTSSCAALDAAADCRREPRCGSDEFPASSSPPDSRARWAKDQVSAVFRGLKERPGDEGPTGEPPYWEVVRSGRDVIPILIESVTDESQTGVTLWNGGIAVVGDLAKSALLQIAPELERTVYDRFLSPRWIQKTKECGECAYELFVQQIGARKELQRDILRWWTHAGDIRWRPCSGVKFGGIWATQTFHLGRVLGLGVSVNEKVAAAHRFYPRAGMCDGDTGKCFGERLGDPLNETVYG